MVGTNVTMGNAMDHLGSPVKLGDVKSGPSAVAGRPGSNKDANSQNRNEDQAEIYQDINFLRDLGPLSRKLSLVSKKQKDKESR